MTAAAGSAAVPALSRWRDRAACAGIADPDVFFPVAEAGPVLAAQEATATAVCARCMVRPECLAFALLALPDGVAGGLTAAERRTHRHTSDGGRAPAVEGGAFVAARCRMRAGGDRGRAGRGTGPGARCVRWRGSSGSASGPRTAGPPPAGPASPGRLQLHRVLGQGYGYQITDYRPC